MEKQAACSWWDVGGGNCLVVNVATSSYIYRMPSVGIRELKNNLSHYIRLVVAGSRITVTDRGRVVAELVASRNERSSASRYDELIASGSLRPAIERGDPLADFPAIKLPRGTAARLIHEDRDDR